jgi:hypothetical protein
MQQKEKKLKISEPALEKAIVAYCRLGLVSDKTLADNLLCRGVTLWSYGQISL